MPVQTSSTSPSCLSPSVAIPELGLVCITTSQAVRYKTLTRKRLLLMSPEEQTTALRSLYLENLRRFNQAIEFCHQQAIRLYRLPSNLFPFGDTPLGRDLLDELAPQLRQAGDRAKAYGLRLVLHPEQFVVLNSDNPTVIENSITVLSALAYQFDLMGQPQSPWTTMNIHGGKGDRVERLIQVIRDLPDPIRTRLTLENDEHMYSATSIFEICQASGVAMVFDAHHHLVRERLDSYDDPSIAEAIAQARSTWPDPTWQLVHISNGRDSLHDPSHSDVIWNMPEAFRQVPWIEIEAKHKEEAIARLRQEWLQPMQLS
ncbi:MULTISPECIES: UV damage endonuclease UvsE [unclassified Leptolyngbya]|uniref:UV damage endonuclease UvsE n=1 Tax=unclassified Leptolyngbya TaxID=2650499 RepID=UPI0016854CB7|nr:MULTISPECIES: UV damage endonuclease UvsE [unclassified Leptolyngbya]MBD1913975.1 UV damage endonuclease UvsE [Leptolyngbya sp. FACHB-8]MBD2155942.1 UV damage endonuclease UvsE [Leptolyngbya sp. FACHB-16]